MKTGLLPSTKMGKTAAILTLLAIILTVISRMEDKGLFSWSL